MPEATTQPAGSRISPYWRSLDELQETDEFKEFLAREFPVAASEFPEGVSRRRWLQLMSASFALAGAAGCRWETEKIAPFADRPEGYIPGTQQHYATNVSWAGAPRHLLVTKFDERPIKVEGNPEHPASRGATDAITQAITLSLYDPDRAKNVIKREGGKEFTKTWKDFEDFLAGRLEALGDGAGVAILAPPIESHTVYAAMQRVKDRLPAARFYQHTPLSRENELAGAEMAFGKRVRPHYQLAKAKTIVAVDCDLLSGLPDSLRLARDYADGRDPDGEMNRLWAIESFFSTTGATADHRLPIKSSEIGAFLAKLHAKLEASMGSDEHKHGDPVEGEPTPEEFLDALVDDLSHHQGESLVVVGPGQPPEVHVAGHLINQLIGALGETVVYTDEPAPSVEVGSIDDLIAAGAENDTLLILDGNPAYDAPAVSGKTLADAIAEIPHTVRLGVYDDETSRICDWSLPQTHSLEEWGDVISWDGTVGVSQPMIDPLLGGRSVIELLAILAGDPAPNARQMVADAVSAVADVPGEQEWNKLLHDGMVEGSGFEPTSVEFTGEGKLSFEEPAADSVEIVFTPSSSTFDGRLANNGWLQETPDFLTKLTWDNAALVAPSTAKELGLKHGKLATLTVGETSVTAPVYVMPGQAAGSIAIAVGYGRTAAGRVGGLLDASGRAETGMFAHDVVPGVTGGYWAPAPAEPVGVDVYPLRGSSSTGFVTEGVSVSGTATGYLLATTQDHHAIDQQGLQAIGRRTGELIRTASLEHYEEHPEFAPHMAHDVEVHADGQHRTTEPLFNIREYKGVDPDSLSYAWGMSIDLNKCIGCNACMVACQAENNVPVVGKDQVAKGREMHWIRIDRYFKGVANPSKPDDEANFDNPQVAHQPVACQQCETAPCEQVCPVAATVHDDEGLNGMTYNRCIGTRYCANNCPYKVRRFNYLRYTKPLYEESNKLLTLVTNPEVTVRSRGVMEKCTYCVQRISSARITAKNEGRTIKDGDVVSACQQACPTRAIEFGDLRDESSVVKKMHDSPRAYGILTELMTQPRTKFLAKIRNPHWMLARPDLDPEVHHGGGHGDDHGDGHGEDGHHHDDDHHHDESHADEATHA